MSTLFNPLKSHSEKLWLFVHFNLQKLHGNWKEEGSYTLSEIERSRIVCFTKNSTQLITVVHEAGEEFDEFLVKIWCRKTLHCEKACINLYFFYAIRMLFPSTSV